MTSDILMPSDATARRTGRWSALSISTRCVGRHVSRAHGDLVLVPRSLLALTSLIVIVNPVGTVPRGAERETPGLLVAVVGVQQVVNAATPGLRDGLAQAARR